MSYQVIRQPNGKLALWSTVIDGWARYDATADEVADYFAERAAQVAREEGKRIADLVRDGHAAEVYRGFAMSFEEADAAHRENGHTPTDWDPA